jgi:CRP-like cAMP-binding protein
MSKNHRSEAIASTSESLGRWHSAAYRAARIPNEPCGKVEPQQNEILEALPESVGRRLFHSLECKVLRRGHIVHDYGQTSQHVYFPVSSIFSLQCVSTSGSTVQIAMVGSEGLVGLAALLGSESSTVRASVWKSGCAYELPADLLGREFDNSPELRSLFLRYLRSLFSEMAQTAFCNRYHSIHQQFSRWLLQSLDRLPGRQLDATQEMIANTLGVRVASISEVACKLQDIGVINYHRGRITVLDRTGLENIACECYAAVRSEKWPGLTASP